ncbi:hypothetical protein BJ508DRAFT_334899 [Ascobolus immersus RN42]|uniref:BTB domain-containing protein n=1 Tax=Ascobolus immersus RN42 TaxID=1160509 RepID=A0A3N4HED8_ASCIM|nr:hypothetical protein BJ508DRAFT_334899 [Ascobolus immersus RN42]
MADAATQSNGNGKRPIDDVENAEDTASKRTTGPRLVYAKLTEGNLAQLKSGDYSDLVVKCRGKQFKAHKFILCSQSEFFQACVEVGMKESSSNEIDLVDEDPEDVRRLLEYLYCGNFWEHETTPSSGKWVTKKAPSREAYSAYKDPGKGRSEEEKHKDPLIICIRLFVLGDKLRIPGLKEVVLAKVKQYQKDRLEPESDTPKERVPELLTDKVIKEWHRLMDALDFCLGELDGQSGISGFKELTEMLLFPLAKVAPRLLDPKGWTKQSSRLGEKYLLELEQEFNFKDLMDRLTRNPQLATKLFRLTCWEGLKMIRSTESNKKLRKCKTISFHFRKVFKALTAVMDDPKNLEHFKCNRKSANEEGKENDVHCTSEKPMVPIFDGGDKKPITFECRDCGWISDVDFFEHARRQKLHWEGMEWNDRRYEDDSDRDNSDDEDSDGILALFDDDSDY